MFLSSFIPILSYFVNQISSFAPVSLHTMSMKALRFHGERDLRYEDIPEPQVGKGQVKVSIVIRPKWLNPAYIARLFKSRAVEKYIKKSGLGGSMMPAPGVYCSTSSTFQFVRHLHRLRIVRNM